MTNDPILHALVDLVEAVKAVGGSVHPAYENAVTVIREHVAPGGEEGYPGIAHDLETLRTAAAKFLEAFHENPGHSDLDREQPITITVTLGDLRDLNYALNAAPQAGAGSGTPANRAVPEEPAVAAPPAVRRALKILLNHVEPGWENCKTVVEMWLDGHIATPRQSEET